MVENRLSGESTVETQGRRGGAGEELGAQGERMGHHEIRGSGRRTQVVEGGSQMPEGHLAEHVLRAATLVHRPFLSCTGSVGSKSGPIG